MSVKTNRVRVFNDFKVIKVVKNTTETAYLPNLLLYLRYCNVPSLETAMKRREFLKNITVAGMSALVSSGAAKAAKREKSFSDETAAKKSGFTLWQLASQVNTIGNSYVLLTDKGKVVVMDGGVPDETSYLRGFLGALGNEVEAWFISHPHNDHMGALNEILKNQGDIKIKHVYHSRFSDGLIDAEPAYSKAAHEFYANLDKAEFTVTDLREPGLQLKIDGLNIKILGVTNEEFRTNPYNNSSMIIRVWDKRKSVVFLGDAGVECGNKVLSGTYAGELDCDYLQMAHHGQQGCDENFYKTVNFKACLWPTPLWVWNNDAGKGINTAHLKTFDTRGWMKDKGIAEHHVSCLDGLWKLA